ATVKPRDAEVETLRRKQRWNHELLSGGLHGHGLGQLCPLRRVHLPLGIALDRAEWRKPDLYRRKPAGLYVRRRSVFGFLRLAVRCAGAIDIDPASRSPAA